MGGGYDAREKEHQKQRQKDYDDYRLGNAGINTGSLYNQYGKQNYDARMKSGGGGCFPSGTMIDAPGGARDIAAIRAGDAVIAVDPATGSKVARPVLSARAYRRRALWRVSLTGDRELLTTASHSFLTTKGWRKAGALRAADTLVVMTESGVSYRTVAASGPDASVADVYNLIVDGNFTFVANGAVVHSFSHFRGLRMQLWRMIAAMQAVGGRAPAAAHHNPA